MKLRYALLIALACLCAAPLANANPIDPSVIINRSPHDATTFSMNSITDPLVITLNGQGLASSETFEYTGTKTLTKLFVELVGALPLEQFDCISDIFTGCGSFNTGNNNSVGLIFEDGTLTTGQMFTAAVASPEPATIVLLLTGGAMLLGFSRKW